MKNVLLFVFLLATQVPSTMSWAQIPTTTTPLNLSFKTLTYPSRFSGAKDLILRIGIKNPSQPVIGDVIYIHGFGSRLDNHIPLFEAWNQQGLRVIAFDLPSHGENQGPMNHLNHFNFKDLSDLVVKVENFTLEDSKRPLILAGWSTGGLIVIRMMQKSWNLRLSRPVSGLVAFSPAISVRQFPWTFGNQRGYITTESITHNPNPPHPSAKIVPNSPFWNRLILGFSNVLLFNSVRSQVENYPSDIPTLILSGSDSEDTYVKNWVARDWVTKQNRHRLLPGQLPIQGVSCPNAKHELDNEPESYGGLEARNYAAIFAAAAARSPAQLPSFSGQVCHAQQ